MFFSYHQASFFSVLLHLTEEVSKQKLTAKYVQRELLEADEANLLDEEGVFIHHI